jgi:hypothetical protein
MQEQAIQDRQNGVAKINQIIEETKQNHEFSESDKMLMEECQVELENYQYNNKLSFNITTHNILKQTISNLESEEKYKLYGKIQYESKKTGLLEKILYFDKNVTKNTRQEELLHKLFSHSYSVIIATNMFRIGFIAYSLDDVTISGSMADWFTSAREGFDWWELSCRGIFQSANQLSGRGPPKPDIFRHPHVK